MTVAAGVNSIPDAGPVYKSSMRPYELAQALILDKVDIQKEFSLTCPVFSATPPVYVEWFVGESNELFNIGNSTWREHWIRNVSSTIFPVYHYFFAKSTTRQIIELI